MAAQKYPIYVHALHSRLQMIRNRLYAFHGMTSRQFIYHNTELFEKAVESVKVDNEIMMSKPEQHQAVNLFLGTIELGHPIQSKDYNNQMRLIIEIIRERLAHHGDKYEVYGFSINGAFGQPTKCFIAVRELHAASIDRAYATTPGMLQRRLINTVSMADWAIAELSKQRPGLFE